MRYIQAACVGIIVLLLIDCSSHRGGQDAFKALEAARVTYTSVQAIALDLRDREIISVDVWNHRIVPLDHEINRKLYQAYGFLKLYRAAQNEADYAEFVALLRDATQLISELNSVIDEVRK